MSATPAPIMFPHDGFGAWTPTPRNESAASRRIEFARISGANTTSVDARFGRTSA